MYNQYAVAIGYMTVTLRAESTFGQGGASGAVDAQRDESLSGERPDEIVQVRFGDDGSRRTQLSAAEAGLQVDGSLLPLRRARQEHPQEQVDASRSGRIPGLGTHHSFSIPFYRVRLGPAVTIPLCVMNVSPFQIAARPGAHNLRCMLRVAFVPKDAYDLLRKDQGAFEYLYMQVPLHSLLQSLGQELLIHVTSGSIYIFNERKGVIQ